MANLERINEKAAGIDIGAEMIFVSMDGENVKSYSSFTSSLDKAVQEMVENGITTVVMEATGVLWLPIFDKIEGAGIKVNLVNASHAKNIPAQKSDPADCRWLQKLHSYGLLRASFVPSDSIRTLRTYVRIREDHIDMSASHIQHMQKAFELMNIKLHNVISDIKGVSGRKIIESILDGEYDAEKLAFLCDASIKKNKLQEVIESLRGNFKVEYIFMLNQAYKAWQFYQTQIKETEKQISELLNKMSKDLPEVPKSKSSPSRHNRPEIENLHQLLVKINQGKNAACLPGFSDTTVMKLIAELGTDYGIWPTENHFTSWLGLSPRKHQSGKTNKTRKGHKKNTKAGQIFKESVMSIAASKHLALKGFYHRIKSKHGKKAANKAAARKLAVLFYNYMTKGFEYVEQGLIEYEKRYKEIMIRNLTKKAHELGFQLISD